MIHEENKNINKETEPEEILDLKNNWNEKFTTGHQHQTVLSRIKTQWTWRQVFWNYQVIRAKGKKNENREESPKDLWENTERTKHKYGNLRIEERENEQKVFLNNCQKFPKFEGKNW